MSLATPNGEFSGILAIVTIALAVPLHYYINRKKLLFPLGRRLAGLPVSEQVIGFSIEKLTGFILFGIIPFIIFLIFLKTGPGESGLTAGKTLKYWYLLIIMPLFAAIMSYFSSRNSKNWSISPQMRIKEWHLKHILMSFSGWFIYLLGYEFMIRGLLWFLCLAAFGFWPALVINVVIYSVIHIPKGMILTLGTIPVGVLFCLLTWLTGSFILALVTHLTISVTNDFFSVLNNPDFKLKLRK